jgi:hypothetical protein
VKDPSFALYSLFYNLIIGKPGSYLTPLRGMATRLFRFSIAFAPVLYGRLSYVEYCRYIAPRT